MLLLHVESLDLVPLVVRDGAEGLAGDGAVEQLGEGQQLSEESDAHGVSLADLLLQLLHQAAVSVVSAHQMRVLAKGKCTLKVENLPSALVSATAAAAHALAGASAALATL